MIQTDREKGAPTSLDRFLAYMPLPWLRERKAGQVARYDAIKHKGEIMGSREDIENSKLLQMAIVAYVAVPAAVIGAGFYIYNQMIQ